MSSSGSRLSGVSSKSLGGESAFGWRNWDFSDGNGLDFDTKWWND